MWVDTIGIVEAGEMGGRANEIEMAGIVGTTGVVDIETVEIGRDVGVEQREMELRQS